MTPLELRALILSDSIATQYMMIGDDAACAERCNEIAPKIRRLVPNIDIKRLAILSRFWSLVSIKAGDVNADMQVRSLAVDVEAWIGDVTATTNLEIPEVQQMLSGLVSCGLMTTEQSQAIVDLSFVPQVVTDREVEAVRIKP